MAQVNGGGTFFLHEVIVARQQIIQTSKCRAPRMGHFDRTGDVHMEPKGVCKIKRRWANDVNKFSGGTKLKCSSDSRIIRKCGHLMATLFPTKLGWFYTAW